MSGPRDKYDTSAMRAPDGVDDEQLARPLPPHEHFRIRAQDHFAAELQYAAAVAYNSGVRSGFALYLLDEMAHAYRTGQLEHMRLRLDRDRWNVVARTLVTFMRAEWIAQREAERQRDAHERATTTRRIVATTPPPQPGALMRGGALYGR